MSSSAPVISFELGVGEFRIVTAEAVYQIKVSQELIDASEGAPRTDTAPPPLVVSTPAPATVVSTGDDQGFFQEISQELFGKVGQLARKLSVSVEDLPDQLDNADLSKTGEELENAKGQLEEVVEITERASMTIMDIADQIQNDMDELRGQMEVLNALDLATHSGPAEEGAAPVLLAPAGGALSPQFMEKLSALKNFLAGLTAQAGEAVPGPAPAEAAPAGAAAAMKKVVSTVFDLDVIFQTIYEFCTNESVKDHIKAMRAEQNTAFDAPEVARSLAELSKTVNVDDGFYEFPIPAVLKILYSTSGSEDYKTILKKMNQTAGSIFLDSVLAVEGQESEIEVPDEDAAPTPAPAPEPASAGISAAGASAADLQSLAEMAADLERLAKESADAVPAAPAVHVAEGGEGDGPVAIAPANCAAGYTSILTSDRDTILNTVNMSNALIKNTSRHLTRIIEAMSFQDLSGQRIKKIVSLIGEIQVQLLSVLVSVDAKLKAHQEAGAAGAPSSAAEADQMAQAEVDRMMEKVAAPSEMLGPGAEGRLNQNAVNDLLAQLGF